MGKANEEIRVLIKEKGVYQWEVAEALGVSEATLIRWLRIPLNEAKKKELMAGIEKATSKKTGV